LIYISVKISWYDLRSSLQEGGTAGPHMLTLPHKHAPRIGPFWCV